MSTSAIPSTPQSKTSSTLLSTPLSSSTTTSLSGSSLTSPSPQSTTTAASPTTHVKLRSIPHHPCLPCELLSLPCSFTNTTIRQRHKDSPCLRCLRNNEPLCIIQTRSKHIVCGKIVRKAEFTAAVPADPEVVNKRGMELLEIQKEKEDSENWVLPSLDGERVRARVDEEGRRF